MLTYSHMFLRNGGLWIALKDLAEGQDPDDPEVPTIAVEATAAVASDLTYRGVVQRDGVLWAVSEDAAGQRHETQVTLTPEATAAFFEREEVAAATARAEAAEAQVADMLASVDAILAVPEARAAVEAITGPIVSAAEVARELARQAQIAALEQQIAALKGAAA